MKKLFHYAYVVALAMMMTAGITSCTDNDNDGGEAQEIEDLKQEEMKNLTEKYVNDVVYPTYDQLAGATESLYGKIEPLLGMQPRTVETALEPISGKVIFVSLAAFAVAIGAEMLAESGMSLIDWEADWAESTTALAVGMVVAAVLAVVAILVIKARSNGSNAAKTA